MNMVVPASSPCSLDMCSEVELLDLMLHLRNKRFTRQTTWEGCVKQGEEWVPKLGK